MSIFTVLAYDSTGACILEKDEEVAGNLSPKDIAIGLRDRLADCCRVIILSDGKFAFDTNDIRN